MVVEPAVRYLSGPLNERFHTKDIYVVNNACGGYSEYRTDLSELRWARHRDRRLVPVGYFLRLGLLLWVSTRT
jgi:hypothetical protein